MGLHPLQQRRRWRWLVISLFFSLDWRSTNAFSSRNSATTYSNRRRSSNKPASTISAKTDSRTTTTNRRPVRPNNPYNSKPTLPSSPSPSSIGEALQHASTAESLLHLASKLWLPTDDADVLPPHVLHQQVHHEKRLRWSSQLLCKLGNVILNHDEEWSNTTAADRNLPLLQDPRLERAILAAAIPFQDDIQTDRVSKEGRYLKEALCGLHCLIVSITKIAHHRSEAEIIYGNHSKSRVEEALQMLFERAENMAAVAPLPLVVEIRWACNGIRQRMAKMVPNSSLPSQHQLDQRVENLPFDILPGCIAWSEILNNSDDVNSNEDSPVDQLLKEIPFQFDTIVTRTGAPVKERRGTAWIGEPDIGALAYSGKLMAPQPISPLVRQVMNRVEEHVLNQNKDTSSSSAGSFFFDCALCNHYPDGESACKFHTDPEHGSHWERLTCVVAAGVPRQFAFRPIPRHSKWSEWEVPCRGTHPDLSGASKDDDDAVPAVVTLFPGDVVKMFGTCNDDFHHAVYPGSTSSNNNRSHKEDRVSLVLKRAISRNGRKGHGIAGQGRRSRRSGDT